MKKWLCLVGLLLCVAPIAAQDVGTYDVVDCPFVMPYEDEVIGETLECGTLTVPEDHANPDGKTIQLALVIVRSTSDNPQPDPVIYLEGGPGGSAISAYSAFLHSALRAERDIIVLDQRGTGYSLPSLNCWEYTYGVDEPSKACLDRLVGEGVNLQFYHSSQSAHDVEALVAALGYDEVNLWGISYGTRLALTIMRDTNTPLRSVIIDGVYPPQVQGWDENASNGYAAFKVLFDACAANDECNEAYPDLEQVFADTVTALDDGPLVLQDEEGNDTEASLNGYRFALNLYRDLYDSAMVRYLPAQIYAAHNYDPYNYTYVGWDDDTEDPPTYPGIDLSKVSEAEYNIMWATYLGYATPDDLLAYLEKLDSETYESQKSMFETAAADSNGALIDDSSEGFYTTVECYEEIPFNSLEAGRALLEGLPENIQTPLIANFEIQVTDCDLWQLPAADAMENEVVVSDLPVLVMSGEFDPVTPPSWGQSTADALPNGFHYIMPGMGHGVVDNNACPTAIALEFLADPFTAPDDSCVGDMVVEFYINEN